MRTRTPLWRQTPLAIFPVTLGLMGLSLGWRNAASALPIPTLIGDLMLGLATAYFMLFAVSYIAKIIARPGVVMEDIKSPPARAGFGALPATVMMLAAGLLVMGISAPIVWWVGVIGYLVTILISTHAILTGSEEGRRFSPFQYLAFVAFMIAPIAGIKLGFVTLSYWFTMGSLVPFIVVTVGYGSKFAKVRPPIPLRPSLVIILAPVSLFAVAFGQLQIEWAFIMFYWMAWALAATMLFFALWLSKGGWTPIWGAFTFPIAAFINLQAFAIGKGLGVIATTGLIAGLLIGTPLIFYVVWMASKAWMRGDLAKKSGAAVA